MKLKVASFSLVVSGALILGTAGFGAVPASVRGNGSSLSKKFAAVQKAPHEVTVAFADKMGSLEPDLAVNVEEINAAGLIAEGLYEFRYGTPSTPEPGLAQLASVSANQLTWTFTLRPN